ncbi:MAG: putative addiction module antidote protein [Gammaproteobacteria bacterium]|nr:putative addiction module antidote protein [Gammaproteobacteria bacterium]MDQ7074950.1 putative addiction module antidote protein [Gammaproteobacteria bacterium]
MTTKVSEFNPMDYLETDEEIAQYLNDAYQDDNPEVFVIALGHVAKARGVADIAKKSGLNRESLYKVFSGKAKPQWATIQGVMKALNINIRAVS